MPIGIIINAFAIIGGGIVGSLVGEKLSVDFKEKLNMIFSVCALAMGVSSVVLMTHMPAVIFAVILGTIFGLWIQLGEKINFRANQMQRLLGKVIKVSNNQIPEEEFNDTLLTIIVLFCASGTGIYGSLISGMSGDHSILIAKSILDFFTAFIFACTLGAIVATIAVPQFIIFFLLYIAAGVIYPITTPEMIQDFKACGGLIMLATSFRMMKVKLFPTADMIPAMVLVMPCSWIWAMYIVPLIG